MSSIVEQCYCFKASSFNGKANLLATEECLRGLERIYKHMVCTKGIRCRIYTGWSSNPLVGVCFAHQKRSTTMCYDLSTVQKKWRQSTFHIPGGSERDRISTTKKEYVLLDKYERKFEQLSRYATYLVDTEAMKVRRFELDCVQRLGLCAQAVIL